MEKKIHVLTMTTDDGYTSRLCACSQFPIEGKAKDTLRETFNSASRYTSEIITDSRLLETYSEDELRQEFVDAVDDLSNGKPVDYYGDIYEWHEIEVID